MKLAVVNDQGKELRKLDVDDSVFGIEPNMAVLHQAYVTQRNNNRSGTHKTKSRGEVQGSTRKIRMQKYTGRARAGGNRSPTRVGGGVAFGPRPRSYARDLPKKMRRLAIRSALSGKVADGQLVIIDQLALETPKTKEIIKLLAAMGFERSALVVTGSPDKTVSASVRNLERAKALPAAYLNVLDMLNHAGIVMTEDAVRVAEGLWGQKAGNDGKPLAARRHSETIGVVKERTPRKRAEAEKPEPEATAEAPDAEAPAEEAPKPKRAKAPKAEKAGDEPAGETTAEAEAVAEAPAAEATTEEAPKPKRVRKPKAEASTEEKPADGADEAPKPKRAPRAKKKTEEAE